MGLLVSAYMAYYFRPGRSFNRTCLEEGIDAPPIDADDVKTVRLVFSNHFDAGFSNMLQEAMARTAPSDMAATVSRSDRMSYTLENLMASNQWTKFYILGVAVLVTESAGSILVVGTAVLHLRCWLFNFD